MLAALGISSDFVKWAVVAVVVIAVSGVIFAGYRHLENGRSALIAQAQTGAAAAVASQVDKASADFVKAQAEKMATELDAKNSRDQVDQAAWDKTLSEIDALPLDTTPPADPDQVEDKADVEAPASAPKTTKAKKTNVKKSDPAAAIRALDAQLDGMLERSSGAAD